MFKIILLVIAAVLVVFAIVVALQPSNFRITRSIVINAPPAAAFTQVEDFRRWTAWSPYEKLDPNLQRSYLGPAVEGAIYDWVGDNNAGEGCATILESRPGERVRIELAFRKPFQAINLAEFAFRPVGDQTEVTWSMSGERNFLFKAFGLFMNMDKIVGAQFEDGLRQLKAVAESQPRG
ncbi:SRPBCC family protein [Lysobacter sp. CA196]|uniref:SRPBCC family protein n=1 Tax=Lysobacter sp. CA196 TaxID=3455606 RepID=UPI003F8D7C61